MSVQHHSVNARTAQLVPDPISELKLRPKPSIPKWPTEFPPGIVRWWTASRMAVLCPYCGHDHELTRAPLRLRFCLPSGKRYWIVYPFEAQGLGCELDRSARRWRTVGLGVGFDRRLLEGDDRVERLFATYLGRRRQGRRGPLRLKKSQQRCALKSHSECRRVTALPGPSRRRPEPCFEQRLKRLLAGRDRDGNSALLLATMEGRLDAVELLHELGADIDCVNTLQGRTPLMEAALAGHWLIARYLLQRGARTDCVGWYDGQSALQLMDARSNKEERAQRRSEIFDGRNDAKDERDSGDDDGDEDGKNDDCCDDGIDEVRVRRRRRGQRRLVNVHLLKDKQGTVARLTRGYPYPDEWAYSGYSCYGGSENPKYEDVLRYGKLLGYVFPSDFRDRKHRGIGSFPACHAEAKLMVSFLTKHSVHGQDPDSRDDELAELELCALPRSSRPREVKLWVSKGPCKSCRDLRNAIEKQLGMRFIVSWGYGDEERGDD